MCTSCVSSRIGDSAGASRKAGRNLLPWRAKKRQPLDKRSRRKKRRKPRSQRRSSGTRTPRTCPARRSTLVAEEIGTRGRVASLLNLSFAAAFATGPKRMAEPISSLPQRQGNPVAGTTLTAVLLSVVVVAALYFGREVLVPIALAVLLSFVLAPFVRFLQNWFIPRFVAVIGVTLLALAIALGLAALMVAQVNQLASELPRYKSTLREKIQSLRGVFAGTGTLERASEMLKGLQKEIERSEKSLPGPTPSGEQLSPTRPIPVEVRQPDPGALQTLVRAVNPFDFSPYHDRRCIHLRNFHSFPTTGPSESAGASGGSARSPADDCRAR